MLIRSARVVVFLGLFWTCAAAPAQEKQGNWTYWRGPDGQGIVKESAAPLKWGAKENVLWKTSLPGQGNSSPIVWGERIFLTASSKDGNERMILCVSAQDGKILWQKTASKGVPAGRTHGWNGYASASCTTDGERVYAFFGTPGLFCYNLEGELLWKHDFGVFTSDRGWGQAASPFLYGDLVIQNCDNDGAAGLPKGATEKAAPMALVALDKVKGTIRWETPRNQGRGFSTPRLLASPGGKEELILNGPIGVWAYDPASGAEIWHCDRTSGKEAGKFGELIPTSDGSTLYVPSGRPGPFQAIKLGGKGDVTKSHVVWEVKRKGRDVSSQLLVGDVLYGCDTNSVLTAFDVKTGDILYTERLASDAKSLASPVLVQGKVLYLLDTGETVVLEPGRKLKIVGRNVLGDNKPLDFAASPAVVDGRIYVRSQSHLYAIGQK